MKNEKFGCKDYILNLPLSKAQTLFKHKYSMTEHIKMNFKGNKEYERALGNVKTAVTKIVKSISYGVPCMKI